MRNRYLLTIALISALTAGICIANAYPQNNFGTGVGFSGYNKSSDGAAAAAVVNATMNQYNDKAESAQGTYGKNEKKVSNVARDYDESPNAGYKSTYTYIEKDMSDYNPYTGADAGVNDTKSIYTDDLGRLHFFGKGSHFKSNK